MTQTREVPHFPVDSRPWTPPFEWPASTMQPFVPGDVFVGATLLDSPTDDHAGRGRIIQYDCDLNEKGVLWVQGTTHLVYGLCFAPDGVLWAQDPWAWTTVRVDTAGHQLPNLQYDQRPFSKVHFMPDGTLLFTETLVGDHQPLPLTTRYPVLPGHRSRLGDGDLWRYTPEGELVEILEPEAHGGVTGSMAVTHSVLSRDRRTLIYVSETGPRLMQFDLANGRQLPDLRHGADGDPTMRYFDLSLGPDGTLFTCMGDRVEALTESGVWQRTYRPAGNGWALVEARSGDFGYLGNWFSGEIVKLKLDTGEVTAKAVVAPKCLAGIAQYLPDRRA